MVLLCVYLISLLATAASEETPDRQTEVVDETLLEPRVNFTIEGDGPFADIKLSWEPFPCLTKDLVFHQITICDSRPVCLKFSTYDRRMTLRTAVNFQIIFWSHYDVSIEADCLTGGKGLWARRKVYTGPGALLPLKQLEVIRDYKSATLKWPEIPEFLRETIDHFEIRVCRANTGRCDYTVHALPKDTNYTIGNLSPGTEYVAFIQLVKVFEGKFFTSAKISEMFTTEAPPEKDYPPVRNFAVRVEPKDDDVDFSISYEVPKIPPEKILYGVHVEVSDFRGQRIVESNHALKEKILIQGLPFFSMLNVELRVLYQHGDDFIESADRAIRVSTGVTKVTKPEIVKLMAVNGTTALIHWSHSAPKAAAFSYLISKSDGDVVEVDQPGVDSVLLTDLIPERTYGMKVSAYIHYDGKHYHQDSDEKFLKMLPKDALVPKITVKKIVGEELLLAWDIVLPAEEKESCSLWITSCNIESDTCSDTGIADNNSTSVWLSVEAVQNYNVTMRTHCLFFDNLDVDTTSDTLRVFTANRPPTPTRLRTVPKSPTSIAVRWKVNSQKMKLHTGFIVRWTRLDNETWQKANVTNLLYRLEKLEPATRYNISVAGYSIHGAKLLVGEPAFITGKTLFPVPSAVSNLQIEQVSFSRRIQVRWDPVVYDYSSLQYKVYLKCFDVRSVWTNDTSLEFNASFPESSDVKCEVGVAAHTTGPREEVVCGDKVWKSIEFKKLPCPERVDVEFVADGEYLATLVLPKEVASVADLVYQVTNSTEKFITQSGNNSLLIEVSSFFTNVTRLARLCLPDICGTSHPFKFLTNTGAPGPVENLEARAENLTTINLTWKRPPTPNGPIDGYLVNAVDTRADETENITVGSDDTSFEFDAEELFYSYEISVTAFNVDLYNRTEKKLGTPTTVLIERRRTDPPPPINFSTVDNRGKKRIKWTSGVDDEFDVEGFRVILRPESGSKELTFFSTDPELALPQLKPFTRYFIKVSTCLDNLTKHCGETGFFEIFTDVDHPSAPRLELYSQNGTQIIVRWKEPKDPAGPIDGYEFSYASMDSKRDSIDWTLFDRKTRAISLEFLSPSTRYVLRLRAFNKDKNGGHLYSPIASLEVTTGESGTSGKRSPTLMIAAGLVSCALLIGLTYVGLKRQRG